MTLRWLEGRMLLHRIKGPISLMPRKPISPARQMILTHQLSRQGRCLHLKYNKQGHLSIPCHKAHFVGYCSRCFFSYFEFYHTKVARKKKGQNAVYFALILLSRLSRTNYYTLIGTSISRNFDALSALISNSSTFQIPNPSLEDNSLPLIETRPSITKM